MFLSVVCISDRQTDTHQQVFYFYRNKTILLQICSIFWSPVIHTVLIEQTEATFLTEIRGVCMISSDVP